MIPLLFGTISSFWDKRWKVKKNNAAVIKYSLLLFFTLLMRTISCAEDATLNNSLRGSLYEPLAGIFESTIERLSAKGVPPKILEDRILEAIAKRVLPGKIELFVEAEEIRLGRLADAVSNAGIRPASASKTMQLFQSLSIVTTGIVSVETAESYLKAVEPGAQATESLTAWISACISLYNLSGMADAQLRPLGISVLKSRLKPSGYSVLPGIFLKAKRNGLSDQETLRAMTRILDSGGGFFQLEDEITRRKGP
jgi:hypothetical protein